MSSGNIPSYDKKRNFSRTPEPEGKISSTSPGRLYVIQKHAATRLHYDLRLEWDGVLKSWAVPKGPSLDPDEKHLAAHVEDHPVEYGSFEGVIPEGEYGGGTVMVWDQGEWEPHGDPRVGYEKGKLTFELRGRKLQGTWTLARMHGEAGEEGKNWLLIKKRDRFSRPASEFNLLEQMPLSVGSGRTMEEIASAGDQVWHARYQEQNAAASEPRGMPDLAHIAGAKKAEMPREFIPQHSTLTDVPPSGEAWLHEIKYDGYRMACFIKRGSARLVSRNGLDWSQRFSSVVRAVSELPLESAVLDGEIVVLTPEGKSDFQALQNVLKGVEKGTLIYYLFDLPFCNGYDLTQTTLAERKQILRTFLPEKNDEKTILRYTDHIQGRGALVFTEACRIGLEGIISKASHSVYEHRRTTTWRKTKCLQRQEFVICGYTDRTGSATGFGALLLGFFEQEKLIYAGRVGTGFTERSMNEIYQTLLTLETQTPSVSNPPAGSEAKGLHWVRPELVAEVAFSEWTSDNRLRQPSFKGIREDKAPREVAKERSGGAEAQAVKDRMKKYGQDVVKVGGIALSNPDRVMYPEVGVTKKDLAGFYEEISGWILPHIVGRPLTIVRCPEGWRNECFFQKHVNETMPEAIHGVTVKPDEEPYIVIDDLQGLITLVQHGVLEFHPMTVRKDSLERPDLMTFDLDPDPGVSWEDVIQAAFLARNVLAENGLASFVKTSGGKGLHVVVPIEPQLPWEDIKDFAGRIAHEMVRREPKKYIATMSKARRGGKIFIDYFRNSRGATSVAAYSTRARAGAPVSTPLDWNELSELRDAAHFTVQNVPQRIASIKKDPWSGYHERKQRLQRKPESGRIRRSSKSL